jgi:hemerythrin
MDRNPMATADDMTLIAWQPEFEIGIESIDHEHRGMIDLLNTLYGRLGQDAAPEEVLDFLGDVLARIAAHFALEESLMRTMNYDQYAAHKTDHEDLLDEIRAITDAYEQADTPDYQTTLARCLREWFNNHFRDMDARLHRLTEG